jgi:parallel beta-helix repeat protein
MSATNCTIRSNTVDWNGRSGIWLERASNNVVNANSVTNNSQAQPLAWSNLTIGATSNSNLVSENVFVGSTATVASGPRFDVTIAADCDDNRIIGNHLRPSRTDTQGLAVGGIQNDNPRTIIANNT